MAKKAKKKVDKKPDLSEVTIEAAQARILNIVKGLMAKYEKQLDAPDFEATPKDIMEALRLAREVEEFDSRFQSIQAQILKLRGEISDLEDKLIGLIEK